MSGDTGRLRNGKTGFYEERWEFWKSRFEELARDESLAEQTRDACDGAARMIGGMQQKDVEK